MFRFLRGRAGYVYLVPERRRILLKVHHRLFLLALLFFLMQNDVICAMTSSEPAKNEDSPSKSSTASKESSQSATQYSVQAEFRTTPARQRTTLAALMRHVSPASTHESDSSSSLQRPSLERVESGSSTGSHGPKAGTKTVTPSMAVGTPATVRERIFSFNRKMQSSRDLQIGFADTREKIKAKKKAGPLDEMNKYGLKQMIKEQEIQMKGRREQFKVTTMKDAKKLAKSAGPFDNEYLDKSRYKGLLEKSMKWNIKKPSKEDIVVHNLVNSPRWTQEGYVPAQSDRHSFTARGNIAAHNEQVSPSSQNKLTKHASPFSESSGSRRTAPDNNRGSRSAVEHAVQHVHQKEAPNMRPNRHRTTSEASVNQPSPPRSPGHLSPRKGRSMPNTPLRSQVVHRKSQSS